MKSINTAMQAAWIAFSLLASIQSLASDSSQPTASSELSAHSNDALTQGVKKLGMTTPQFLQSRAITEKDARLAMSRLLAKGETQASAFSYVDKYPVISTNVHARNIAQCHGFDVTAFNTADSEKKTKAECSQLEKQYPGAAKTALSELPSIPKFRRDADYALVRKKMIQDGWMPFHSKDADACADGDSRCQGRPEMEACAGTGMANCRFLWKKSGRTVGICTVGEQPAMFDQVCE